MWPSDLNALDIHNGEGLEQFDLGEIVIGSTHYTVLTGYETTEHRCWWCGAELKRKAKHYCYGHMTQYYNHFNWGYASFEARKRAGGKCQNCEETEKFESHYTGMTPMTSLAVHHIVPLKGAARFFSAYNLPFNLIVLCKVCHLEAHAAMRPPPKPIPTKPEILIARGQLVLI